MGSSRRSSLFAGKEKVHPQEYASEMKPLHDPDKGWNGNMRLKVGYFMQKLIVELFFTSLVLVYGGMVFVQISLDEEDLAVIEDEFTILDLVLGSILLVEILLKLYAFGAVYLKSCWNSFDAVVVIASFVLSIIATLGTQSLLLLVFLRIRPVLRVFRVFVVYERVKARSKAVKHSRMKGSIEAPLEHVLRILAELQCHVGLLQRIKDDVEYCAEIIKSNRLYDTGGEILQNDKMDTKTKEWLQGELIKQDDNAITVVGKVNKGHHPTIFKRGMTENSLMPMEHVQNTKFNDLLKDVDRWCFDIFKADEITNGHALSHIGIYLFHRDTLNVKLGVELATVRNFLTTVENGYVKSNTYHNAIHGADVMQSCYYFINRKEIAEYMSPLDNAAALLAAAVHDIGHNGYNNAFQIATQSELAIRYNDVSVFENYHIAHAFELMKSGLDTNVLGGLDMETHKQVRSMMIEMVLGTDMGKHFEDVTQFKTKLLPPEGEQFNISNMGEKRLLLKLILHTCDVSNPAKEQSSMLRWTDRVVEEFFCQGDKEREMNLPVSAFMDRSNCGLMKQQLGFIDYIVGPLFELWGQFIPDVQTDCVEQLLKNREFWVSKGEEFKPSDIQAVVTELLGAPVSDSFYNNQKPPSVAEEIV